jgi:predicted nucleotidyltransferase
MTNEKYGIPEDSLEKLLGVISREPRVEGIVLYGSRAKGTFRSGSDIDLCLDAPDLDYPSLMRMENELDDLLLPWKIDLAVRQRIDNLDLVSHIERVGKPLFKRETT